MSALFSIFSLFFGFFFSLFALSWIFYFAFVFRISIYFRTILGNRRLYICSMLYAHTINICFVDIVFFFLYLCFVVYTVNRSHSAHLFYFAVAMLFVRSFTRRCSYIKIKYFVHMQCNTVFLCEYFHSFYKFIFSSIYVFIIFFSCGQTSYSFVYI